jgi:thiol:disulfide interchange protein DsbG
MASLAVAAMGAVRAGSLPPLSLTVAQANAIVARASHGSAHVVEVFPGPDGLVGAIAVGRSGNRGIVWLTPHGGALFLGGVLRDPDGRDLTDAAMHSIGMQLSPAAVLAQASDPERHGILVGSGGPLLTVLLDPDGVDGQILYDALSPSVASGRVRVRYLLIGTLKPDSVVRAASILAAAQPAQALAANAATYDGNHQQGGFAITERPGAAFVRAVERNNELFARAGAPGTPVTYYCSRATRKALAMIGVPPNIEAFLAQADPSGVACGSDGERSGPHPIE